METGVGVGVGVGVGIPEDGKGTVTGCAVVASGIASATPVVLTNRGWGEVDVGDAAVFVTDETTIGAELSATTVLSDTLKKVNPTLASTITRTAMI